MFVIVQHMPDGSLRPLTLPNDPSTAMEFETMEQAENYLPLIDMGDWYGPGVPSLRVMPTRDAAST